MQSSRKLIVKYHAITDVGHGIVWEYKIYSPLGHAVGRTSGTPKEMAVCYPSTEYRFVNEETLESIQRANKQNP